jgi:hypothetical protein
VRRGPVLVALAALLATVAALLATAPRRDRDARLARRPSAENPGRVGLEAAADWLVATGRPASRRAGEAGRPPPGAVVVLAAPAAPLSTAESATLLEVVEAGGLLVYAMGDAPQPSLDGQLAVWREARAGERVVVGAPDDPLLTDLTLTAGESAVRSQAPGARAVAGPADRPAALLLERGRGEILVLSDPVPLDNLHIETLDHLTLWVRLAARGPVSFDERWLLPHAAASGVGPAGLLLLQSLLVGALLLAALARRRGVVRAAPATATRRTVRDYLTSLAALYRRAGAEDELAADTWRRLRRRLEPAGMSARLSPQEVAGRLAGWRPRAAEAFLDGEAALRRPGPGRLLSVTRAAADVEAGLSSPAGASGASAKAP